MHIQSRAGETLTERPIDRRWSADVTHSRFDALTRVVESFSGSLDLDEVIKEIVTATLEAFKADRAWLLHPASLTAEFASVAFEANSPGNEGAFGLGVPIPLASSRRLMARAFSSSDPIIALEDDPDLDPFIRERFHVRSQILQILRPGEGEPWVFGMHQCAYRREWTRDESALFRQIGRFATLALNNALVHDHATRDAARMDAILDQIPEAAAIYSTDGRLERKNRAAEQNRSLVFGPTLDERLTKSNMRHADGSPVELDELPAMRGLRGERSEADFLYTDAPSGDDRVVHIQGTPVLDDENRIIGSLILCRDVTEERDATRREQRRRRRADALATLGIELMRMQGSMAHLDKVAELLGTSMSGDAFVFIYQKHVDALQLVGVATHDESRRAVAARVKKRPYRSGEGLAGTVFEINKPLLFSDARSEALREFARDDEERALIDGTGTQSVIAAPIEWYGERIGAIVVSSSQQGIRYNVEDLAFVRAVSERVAAASHISSLHRLSGEGHRAAEELARREVEARGRFEAVLESAPIGIAVISADELRFELANPLWIEYAARFGKISRDARVVDLRVADVLPGLEPLLREVADKGEAVVDEVIEVRQGRHSWYIKRIISPVRGRLSGATQSLTVLLQDVTEQVLTNNEVEALAKLMEERSARLDSILGSMTDALWVYDVMGNVIDVNPAALAMFGLGSRSEAIARGRLADFNFRYFDGSEIPIEEMPYSRALRGEVVPDFLASAKQLITGNNLDLSIAAAPIQIGGIVGAVLVIRDITALQELDRKKDEFLSVASHELRTPLTTIKGYTQLLAQGADAIRPDDRDLFLKAVLGEIERMMGLISELLDVSRIETKRLEIHPQPVDWIEFLRKQVDNFRLQNADREMRFVTSVETLPMSVDVDRMRQVIDNLLSNALKYSPEKSPIEMIVDASGDDVITEVIDHGIGIPKDEMPFLFERFHRARNVSSRYYGGLGLGLYIARAIVEEHDGTIKVESEEGEGSRFTLCLPRG